MDKPTLIAGAVQEFISKRHFFERFKNAVVDYFKLEPSLNIDGSAVIYTIKSRLKDIDHLRAKIQKKWSDEDPTTEENIFSKVTDLAGVRILLLFQDEFPRIHEHIMNQIKSGEWFFVEPPKVYSWDPEATEFFEAMGLKTEIKETYYTSIHYVVKPQLTSEFCCEIQVRTLFEEIWGEIDHSINYPVPSENQACREQLRVLSKLVSTGTRLADAIYRTKDL